MSPVSATDDERPSDDEARPVEPVVAGRTLVVLPESLEDLDEFIAESGATLLGPVEGTPYFEIELPLGATMEAFLQGLDEDLRIISGEANLLVSAPEGGGATLPIGGDLLPSAIPQQPELLRIGLQVAHTRTLGAGVRVAVIDSGVIFDHPSLVGRLESGGYDFVDDDQVPADLPNGLDDDGDGRVDEGFGHGTFVASLILAVAPEASILPLRVLNSDSVGESVQLARAIDLAVDAGVDVINLSVGMDLSVDVVKRAVKTASERGVMVVSSAGNSGALSVTFPGSLSDSLAVMSVSDHDTRPGFASYGDDVDLAAPGLDLIGAFPNATGAVTWSGSSFSAAIVTGGYCLVLALNPTARPEDIWEHLEDWSVDIEPANPGLEDQVGKGRIDLDAATARPVQR